jgi:aerobic-type carbon monoxide dehydrogenase small subunit (CoxS/CutS family)
MKVTFFLNGERVSVNVEPNRTLLSVLREEFGLIGTKEGCGLGECGACTVLFNREPAYSCILLAPQVEGAHVTTIEGVTPEEGLNPLQEAFINRGAVQCGFCTSGMIMAAHALLEKNPTPTLEEIKEGISGNLCRCTGYAQIIEAISEVARKTDGKK